MFSCGLEAEGGGEETGENLESIAGQGTGRRGAQEDRIQDVETHNRETNGEKWPSCTPRKQVGVLELVVPF